VGYHESSPMPAAARTVSLLLCACWLAGPLAAQLPFYTDDPAVTEQGKFHFEFFNEFDALQLQYPNIRQNTANYKLNYGLPHSLELDVDVPYLAILRAVGTPDAYGGGDTNLGIKWEFHKESRGSESQPWAPASISNFRPVMPAGNSVPVSSTIGSI